jgi:hypothetical protein
LGAPVTGVPSSMASCTIPSHLSRCDISCNIGSQRITQEFADILIMTLMAIYQDNYKSWTRIDERGTSWGLFKMVCGHYFWHNRSTIDQICLNMSDTGEKVGVQWDNTSAIHRLQEILYLSILLHQYINYFTIYFCH